MCIKLNVAYPLNVHEIADKYEIKSTELNLNTNNTITSFQTKTIKQEFISYRISFLFRENAKVQLLKHP